MDDTLGIFTLKDRRFYYLVVGESTSPNNLDKLKTTLIAKNLIMVPDIDGKVYGHKYMSLNEARAEEIEIIPVYLTPHIEKTTKEASLSKKEVIDIWD